MFDSGLLLASRPSRSVVLSAGSTTGVDVFALAGSPSIAVDLVLTIETDIEITGLSLAGFTPDSYIYLVCAGYLMGPGGNGGNGYTVLRLSYPENQETQLFLQHRVVLGAPA